MTRSTATFWDAKYSRESFVYGTTPNQFLREYAPRLFSRGDRVLSLGEGEGRNAVWLAHSGADVFAVDQSRVALEKLEAYAADCGVDVQTLSADVCRFDPGEKCWDAIILLHMHLRPADRRDVHARVVRGLRPGGSVICEALRPAQLEKPTDGPPRRRLYRPEQLARDFADLDIEWLETEDRMIEAGEHRGETSVVQLIASKPAPGGWR